MAFFLESTFIGLFFFGWDRLNKWQHFMVTVLMAVGSNLSALWILIANGWMQNPLGAEFSYVTMRMEMTDFWAIVFNPVAQAKFVHTVSAGYVTASLFVLGISSWYLLKGRDLAFARRSFRIAAGFGFASALSVIVLGDESGYTVGEAQQAKMAAIEAMWETEPAPAAFTVFALPNQAAQRNDYELQIPYALGLIGTRSVSETLPGIKEIKEKNRTRIESGIQAVVALEALRKDRNNAQALANFEAHKADLGFGLLLKKYVVDVSQATPAMIQQAVDSTIPKVAPLFWSFRIMVALGFAMLLLFSLALFYSVKGTFIEKKWLLRWAFWFIPMPWIAIELGWIVAEYGRQPWSIYGVLPTHLSVSNISVGNVYASLAGFVGFYTVLLVVEMYLMVKYARQGPASLGTGRYHNEKAAGGALPAGAPAQKI
jgi:cytochrome d ubiquinol oxidase subunit I